MMRELLRSAKMTENQSATTDPFKLSQRKRGSVIKIKETNHLALHNCRYLLPSPRLFDNELSLRTCRIAIGTEIL